MSTCLFSDFTQSPVCAQERGCPVGCRLASGKYASAAVKVMQPTGRERERGRGRERERERESTYTYTRRNKLPYIVLVAQGLVLLRAIKGSIQDSVKGL